MRPIYKRFFRLRQVIGITSNIPYPNNNNKIYEKELKFNETSLINIANTSVPWSVPDSTSAVSSLFNSAHKILPTNSHVPSAHQCPTRLKNTLCTLSDIIFSQLFETVRIRPTVAHTLRPIQDTCVLTTSFPGVWNYQQSDHINQWERWDLGESPSFSFLFCFLLPFVNVRRNMTASVLHKLTIWLWFDVKNNEDLSKWGIFKLSRPNTQNKRKLCMVTFHSSTNLKLH